jgi:ABC-2 type transport system permease protein
VNWRAIRAIIAKDLQVALRSKAVVLPMVIVPLIVVVVLPVVIALAPTALQATGTRLPTHELDDLAQLVERAPAGLRQELAAYDLAQAAVVLALIYLFAPFYLIIPLMVSSVIAADSFAGEKERKTLEALLYSPTSDTELLLAKLLSAWLPGLAVGIGSFVLYGVIANLAGWHVVGRLFFPNLMWIVLVLWVGPGMAALGLGATVLVSARVNTFQEAYQAGSLVVLPVIVLLVGQVSGFFYLHVGFVLLLGVVIWLVAGLLVWFGARTLRRNELLARL